MLCFVYLIKQTQKFSNSSRCCDLQNVFGTTAFATVPHYAGREGASKAGVSQKTCLIYDIQCFREKSRELDIRILILHILSTRAYLLLNGTTMYKT
jgi:hypothetical protein